MSQLELKRRESERVVEELCLDMQDAGVDVGSQGNDIWVLVVVIDTSVLFQTHESK